MLETETIVRPMETKGTPAPPMVTAAVVAKELGLSETGVYEQARRGTLPFKSYNFGRSVRFRRIDIEECTGCPVEVSE